jgi:hypothetical protein
MKGNLRFPLMSSLSLNGGRSRQAEPVFATFLIVSRVHLLPKEVLPKHPRCFHKVHGKKCELKPEAEAEFH